MNASGPRRSARDELREQLMEAARREEELAQPRRRPRRGRRRALGLLVGIGLGAAAVAGAADLISTGEPVPDRSVPGERYQPPVPGAPDLVATAGDPEGATAWGVGVYTSARGEECAIAGQVRGRSLGLVRDGRFHPYERGSTGACGDLKRFPMIVDRLFVDGPRPRTVVYGRARDTSRLITVRTGGETRSARPARGGGFLFVFDGRLEPGEALPRPGAKIAR